MLEFMILMLVLWALSKIPMGRAEEWDIQDDCGFDFKCVDDYFDYRELRQTGWRGDAKDYYKWREEE